MNITGLRQTGCSEPENLTADDSLAETQTIPRCPVVLECLGHKCGGTWCLRWCKYRTQFPATTNT